MPEVNQGESREEYMKRCVPYVKNEDPNLSNDAAVGKCEGLYNSAVSKAGFARFSSMDACTSEMGRLGHLKADAAKICNGILERALKGALLKATPVGLTVLSKASEEDIVVGGYASWEIEDDQGETFNIAAQSKALQKFFGQSPEWQSVTINHGLGPVKEFKLAQPMLKYVDSKGTEYFSHVNEKGTYLISKLRNDDLKATKYYREKARNGELNGYSVNAIPLERNGNVVTDMEYTAITITEKGVMKPVNPMTRDVKVISKATQNVISENEANTLPKPTQKPKAFSKYFNSSEEISTLSKFDNYQVNLAIEKARKKS
jgi:hypothetical protein